MINFRMLRGTSWSWSTTIYTISAYQH